MKNSNIIYYYIILLRNYYSIIEFNICKLNTVVIASIRINNYGHNFIVWL